MGNWNDTVFAPTSTHLSIIQTLFDAYQRECFAERPAQFFCLELCGETGELANLEKKVWKGKQIDPLAIQDEAADVFISLMNYCNTRGINLGAAVENKLARIEVKRAELAQRGEHY